MLCFKPVKMALSKQLNYTGNPLVAFVMWFTCDKCFFHPSRYIFQLLSKKDIWNFLSVTRNFFSFFLLYCNGKLCTIFILVPLFFSFFTRTRFLVFKHGATKQPFCSELPTDMICVEKWKISCILFGSFDCS